MKNRIFIVAMVAGLLAPASAGDFNLNQLDLGQVVRQLKASPAPAICVAAAQSKDVQAQSYNDRFEQHAEFSIAQRFDDLLTLGVKNSAESAAWSACRAGGNYPCEILLSQIDYCNRQVGSQFDCKATAVAYAVTLPPLYDRFDKWAEVGGLMTDPTADSNVAKLERLGVTETAVAQAMAECRQNGNRHCAFDNSGIQCNASWKSCEAWARVFGWR